jgi:hypothetical protein
MPIFLEGRALSVTTLTRIGNEILDIAKTYDALLQTQLT